MKLRNILIIFCLFIYYLNGQTQTKVSLKNNEPSEVYSLDINPFGYTNPNCKKIDLKIQFVFDQDSEKVRAIISCKTTSEYNLIWMSPNAKDLNIIDASSFKDLLQTKYKQSIRLSRHLKKQIKRKIIGKIEGVKTDQCEFADLIADDNVRYTNMIGLLKNEMFGLNKMIKTNSNIELVFNVLNKSSLINISLPTFIPAIKDNLAFSSGKIKLQYAAIPENYAITIHRDPCFGASEEIKKQIDIFKKELSDEMEAKNVKNKSECEKIKEKAKTESAVLKQKYIQCSDVNEMFKDVDKSLENIENFVCEDEPIRIDSCIEASEEIKKQIDILKKDLSDEEQEKSVNHNLNCENIKEKAKTESDALKQKYKDIKCSKVIEIFKEYDKSLDNILVFDCESDSCKQSLIDSIQFSINKINSICQEINILKDKIENKKEVNKLKAQIKGFEAENNRFKEKYNSLPPCEKIKKLLNSHANKIKNCCAEGKVGGNQPIVKSSEIESATSKINDLYNIWGKPSKSHDEFNKITTTIDAKINSMDAKSKAKFKKEIEAYQAMVKLYKKHTNNK